MQTIFNLAMMEMMYIYLMKTKVQIFIIVTRQNIEQLLIYFIR